MLLGSRNSTVGESLTLEIDAPLLQKLCAPSGSSAEGGFDNRGDYLQLRRNSTSRNLLTYSLADI